MQKNLEKVSLKIDFSIRVFCNSLPHAWGNVLQGTGQNVTKTALNDISCNRLPRVSFSPVSPSLLQRGTSITNHGVHSRTKHRSNSLWSD